MLGEGVGPQHDERTAGTTGTAGTILDRPAPPYPPPERLPRQPRHVPLRGDPPEPLGDGGQRAHPGQGVDQARRARTGDEREPARQPPQRVVRGRAAASGVVVVEELRLVRGHVDADRAVAAAALAGQAQVERVPDLRGAPAVGDDLARQHLVQQPGPAARGVLLLPCGPERGAHDPRTGFRRTALGDADTPAHRRREVPAVGRVAEGDVHRAAGQRREPQVLVEPVGAD